MRNKANVVNTIPPSADYPFGRLKDDTGINDGTPICEENNGDIQETVTFFMNRAKITPNGLPDNVSNGYQIADAVRNTAGKFEQINKMNIVLNKVNVDFKLNNVYNKEYLLVRFDSSNDKELVNGINKIIDSDSIEYNCVLITDFNGNFFDNGIYVIENIDDVFWIFPLAAGGVLADIYERLETLELNNLKPKQYVLPLIQTTIPSNTHSLPFTLPLEVFQNILSWEIVWEVYYTDAGNTLIEYQSNKNINMATGNSIMLGRFTNQQTTGFVRFQGFQGVPLNNPKLIITYQPQ